ncbi:type I phosphomannose isomerase catalytic subunit [Spiroplasma tabanidicola]|uniref:Mannose-6-phosphate isomerase n=1 Tax=Spiroplasma tabanidicola TaxID=324079 RepID=A0A6I6C6Y4_9MOLU|nr:type I phosphomannose isomerase catalytic subunit [Spiroplasma tabanidicola]QGS51546.1 mannose-6-phosphate isomerase [Spiroplasma tabanidicola]
MSIYKIKPSFSKRIWGSSKLKELGFNINSNDVGEAWVVSAHENGMGYLNWNGKEISLKDFYKQNSFFKNKSEHFPLLVKIITANDFLSVQVHPNDDYALKKHNSLGKPESWYILDCPKDATLIYGHSATSKEEFEKAIENNQWDKILKRVPISKGDFLYVPPGKIHAITPGVTLYELQRSSDITYRLYDFDRADQNGVKRELHIDDSLNNIKIPDSKDIIIRNAKDKVFESEYFSLFIYEKNSNFKIEENVEWMLMTIIEGNGKLNNIEVKESESLIYLVDEDLKMEGDLKILISWIKS